MKELVDLGNTKFWQFNACVGTNGIVNDRLYYDGFSEATKQLCLAVLLKDRFLADPLIYPIVFCTRHSLELAIKIAFKELFRINNHRQEESIKTKNHNLIQLFNELKGYSKFNGQIRSKIEKIQNEIPFTIRTIIEIDTSGETFRYRRDNKNNNHLNNHLRHINIKNLFSEFEKLNAIIDDFFYYLGSYQNDSIIEPVSEY